MTIGNTVRIVGGLFPAQLIERIARGDNTVPGTAPADYHHESATELNQAINRAWSALSGRWVAFKAARAALPEGDRATTLTRERWLLPLFQELGFGRLQPERAALETDGRTFAISHRWARVPIHLVGAGLSLDKRIPGERGAAASAPHSLVQDFLNHDDAHLWAFVSNGLELRILRDHRSLTQQAFVAFDLETLFDGDQFSAFRLLYLLCHVSRVESDDPAKCRLEQWISLAREDGVRALDRLRAGVETALAKLGSGFLAHRSNTALRARLASGELSTQEYYRQLLRLVYRLIFLFVAEDRDLLLVPDAPDTAKDRYRRLYATRRLRSLALRRRGSAHDDAWHALRLVMRHLDRGCPELALPALGSFLWGSDLRDGQRVSRALPDLDEALLDNEHLHAALGALCAVQDGAVRRPVDWAGVQSDELGIVYEALMEKVPRVNSAAGTFELADAAGNERKTTGSYYTPSSLVDCLLDSALDPVLEEAARKPDAERAILELAVVDPACGSGHFLVAAARRIARRLARVRSGGIEPSPPEVQHALRDVVGRCIYGVDLNPMAVELCKVSLWMEAMEPGRPLSFLDAHIQHGNALLGTTPELMAKGVPDAAWEPLEGDDKQVARALKRRNSRESSGQTSMTSWWSTPDLDATKAFAEVLAVLEDATDVDAAALTLKEARWTDFKESHAYRHARLVADAWCAAFVWPKQPGPEADAAPTMEVWRDLRDARRPPAAATIQTTEALREQYQFFHWHLAFPRVFERGGFDVVLGNPPYLNQLETDTAVGRGVRRLLSQKFGEVKQSYTDLATLFMVVGQMLLRPGGREALVHPLSLFAAQDAAPARRQLASESAITSLWMTTEHIFPSASVFVCAVCLEKEGPRNVSVMRRYSNSFTHAEPIPVSMDQLVDEATWGDLIADLVGVPRVRLIGERRIRDIAGTTADFRDQFYGLAPFIVEDSPGRDDDHNFPPLIITGLIDPAVCLWGVQSCKFAKKKWARPRVDLKRLVAGGLLAAWARGRLVPKLIVATQSRVVEAIADPEGRLINTVPTITVTPNRSDDLWSLLAVLLSPPVSAWALGRYAGAALSISAIKMSADQVGQVPLPATRAPWEQAAHLVELASRTRDDSARQTHLLHAAALMCDAYQVAREPVLTWWTERYVGRASEVEEEGL